MDRDAGYKIGIMTFHAAHNYGSVLQAYATQKMVSALGYQNEIINYRLKNQREFYNLYPSIFGWKYFIHRLMKLPEHHKAKLRHQKFEKFITQWLTLTKNEYVKYDDLLTLKDSYSILISGSDQVWNEHCTAEFKTEPPESILGYYLAFGSNKTIRIAYSSSFGKMTEKEIQKYKKYLAQYDFLSCREQTGADILSKMLGRNVVNTLDPTLVLTREQWAEVDGVYDVSQEYLFVYTLMSRYQKVRALLKNIQAFAERSGLKVICVAPFSPIHISGVEAFQDCGPLDFLSYIRKAKLVITDSFHGTAFSVNFGVPFYSIHYGQDKRIELLLNQLGLQSRILFSTGELGQIRNFSCDYTEPWEKLNLKRQETITYLRKALGEAVIENKGFNY